MDTNHLDTISHQSNGSPDPSSDNQVDSDIAIRPFSPREQFERNFQLSPFLNHNSLLHSRSRANNINTQEDDEQSVSTIKPDGGWGWVVVIASFVIQIIADGVANAHGVIYVELLNVFNESKGKTAWVGSVFSGIPLISGPIASALAEQYGCRPVTIAGGILSAVGFGLSVFVNSVDALCITLGLISGFGLSLVYVTSMFILVRWFDNRLSLSMGIASAGSGIGMFIFSPLVTYLLENYELHGTFLILSGIFLNIVVFGALMREPEEMGFSSRSCNASDSDSDSDDDSKSTASLEDVHNMRRCVSLIEVPTFFRHSSFENTHIPTRSSTDNLLAHKASIKGNQPASVLKSIASPSIHPLLPVEKKKKVRFEKPSVQPLLTASHLPDRRRSYLFGQHHVINWKRYGFHVPLKLAAMESLSCPDLTSEVDLSQEEDEGDGTGKLRFLLKPLRKELRQIRRLLFNVKPLRSVKFVLFCFANLVLYLVVDIPCDYATDNAVTHGMEFQKASFLLSIIGIVTTIGQPIYGYVGDRSWCNSLVLFAVSTFICGLLTIFVPFLFTYEALAAYSGLFGFFISGSNPLFAVILVDIIDEKYFSSAFGLLYFAQGVATLFGPPLAGFLFDITESYDATFYTAAAGMIFASLLMLLFPLIKKIRKHRKKLQLLLGVTVAIGGHGEIAAVEERLEVAIEDETEGIPVSELHPKPGQAIVGAHLLPPGETPPVHVGTHLLPPIHEDKSEAD